MQIQEDKPYDEINITPMFDLAYVLLVIFILMTTATVTELKASLPRASKNAPAKKDDDTASASPGSACRRRDGERSRAAAVTDAPLLCVISVSGANVTDMLHAEI